MQPASTSTQLPPIFNAKPAVRQAIGSHAVEHKRERRVHKEKRSHKTYSSSKPPDLVKKPAVTNWKERGNFHLDRKEWDLAIDAFSNAIMKAEDRLNFEIVGDILIHLS